MKSTLKIALGSMNEPVINMVVVPTDDIRDQLCQQFKERLGYESNLAFVEFLNNTSLDLSTTLSIQPIHLSECSRYINRLTQVQCKAIIPLAFQTLSNEDAQEVLQYVPSRNSKLGDFLESRLPSGYQIEDPVSTEEIYDGEITAVRFTIGKVYYDILDKLTGKVIRDVDSAFVTNQSMVKVSQE